MYGCNATPPNVFLPFKFGRCHSPSITSIVFGEIAMKAAKIIFIIVLFIGIAVSVIAGADVNYSLTEKEQSVLDVHAARLESAVRSQIQVSSILGEIIAAYEGNIDEEYFSRIASTMYNPSMDNTLAYLPDGVVTFVYPLEGNEERLQENVFESQSAVIDSLEAKESGEVVVSGPYMFSDGTMGIVIRNPVYIEDKFLGFTITCLDSELLFSSIGLEDLYEIGYEYQIITSYNGVDLMAAQTPDFREQNATSAEIQIGNNTWKFSIYINNKTQTVFVDALFWFLLILVINFLIYNYISRILKSREKLLLRLVTDPLTKAFNRAKLDQYFSDQPQEVFALFYVDLNKFKPVNDTYGHEMGDKLLVAYVHRLQSKLSADSLVFRLGGDEFALVVPEISNANDAMGIKLRVEELSSSTFTLDSVHINISASVGFALSSDTNDLTQMLAIADEMMYAQKELAHKES